MKKLRIPQKNTKTQVEKAVGSTKTQQGGEEMRLIDAEALIDDAMDRYCKDCDKRKGIKNGKYRIVYEIGDAPCRACDVDDMVNDIESAPTVDAVERKRGEWIEENRRPKSMMFYCSECHRTAYDPQNHHGGQKRCRYAFCPNCGADMRGEANDTEVQILHHRNQMVVGT